MPDLKKHSEYQYLELLQDILDNGILASIDISELG